MAVNASGMSGRSSVSVRLKSAAEGGLEHLVRDGSARAGTRRQTDEITLHTHREPEQFSHVFLGNMFLSETEHRCENQPYRQKALCRLDSSAELFLPLVSWLEAPATELT